MGGRGRFLEGRVICFVEKGSIFWKVGVDSGMVVHINWLKRGYILGGRGRF